MRLFIIVLDIICIVPSLSFSLYLALLTFLAMFRRLREFDDQTEAHRRFAVLVPAHNEETVITRTINSLNGMHYPKDLYDVIVIADNCTDETAHISRSLGATVFERSDDLRKGKGYALRWCIDQIIDSDRYYDAFTVIDADTTVSTNFLSVMDAYLEEGAECIQSSDMIVPEPGVWTPEMTRVAFILHNYVRPLGRAVIGCSSGLNGNGMCFSRGLMKALPWNTYSRVEDLERYIDLTLRDIRIHFAPEAEVRALIPSDPKNAESQRRRWEIGRLPLILKYAGPMITAAVRDKSLMILDALVDLVTPAFMNLFEITCIVLVVHLAAFLLGVSWLKFMLVLWAGILTLEGFHVLGGLKAARADRGAYLALLNTPKYALWKLRLYLKTLVKGDDKHWVRTARENNK